ncbi:hypothetical protein BJX99DRAFT_256265 [Aspergillus californicus]
MSIWWWQKSTGFGQSHAYFNQFIDVHHSSKPRWLDVYPSTENIYSLDPNQVFFVDIGGGIGHYTVGLKQCLPHITNCIIVQEMAAVLPTIIPCEGVEGMEHVPSTPSAKFYSLSNIIHDYPDDKCVLILKNIVSAMGPDSIHLINDMVLPKFGAHWHVPQVDLTMMSMLASLKRTVEQWIYSSDKAVFGSVLEGVPI